MSMFDVEFSYIGFGLYRLIRNEYVYRPEIFKTLTDYKGDRFVRLFWNVWKLR